MSCYVNPPNGDKKGFLDRAGTVIAKMPRTMQEIPAGFLPVCLVDNGFFKAAAVGYSQRELDEFSRADDTRPRTYYMVPIEALKTVSNIDDYLKN